MPDKPTSLSVAVYAARKYYKTLIEKYKFKPDDAMDMTLEVYTRNTREEVLGLPPAPVLYDPVEVIALLSAELRGANSKEQLEGYFDYLFEDQKLLDSVKTYGGDLGERFGDPYYPGVQVTQSDRSPQQQAHDNGNECTISGCAVCIDNGYREP